MPLETTVVLLKPDCLNRGLVGQVVARLEAKGLKIVGMKMMAANDKLLTEHYAHLADKPFFPMIRKFMQSAPIIAVAIEGLDAAKVVRAMTGVTNAREAAPGTIRGDFALSIQSNILHASDSSESAKKELARFFSKDELFRWKRIDEGVLYSEEDLGK